MVESDYFQRAMRIFHEAYSHVIFVIVTDDMEWARQNLKFPGMQVSPS